MLNDWVSDHIHKLFVLTIMLESVHVSSALAHSLKNHYKLDGMLCGLL